MSYTSIVTHPPETRYMKITDDFYAICMDAPDASCAAALLNLFMYWTDYCLNAIRENVEKGKPKPENIEDALWFYRHEDSIQSDLFNIWGVTKLRENRKWLQSVGFIDESVQLHESGRQNMYRVNVPFLQFAVKEAWGGALDLTDGYVIFNGWDALNSTTKKNSSKKGNQKEINTPIPPQGDVAANENIKIVDTELMAMEQAVKTELKQSNTRQQKSVAMVLLKRYTGKDAEKNLDTSALTPERLKRFGLWWDTTKIGKDGKPLTRPKNAGSIKTWVDDWQSTETVQRKEVDFKQRNAKLPLNISQLDSA
jgi:hypothetical protein